MEYSGCLILYVTKGSLGVLFGGQIMIWWSTVIARILSALLALVLKQCVDKQEMPDAPVKFLERKDDVPHRI